jgi:hypothetical protein
LINDFFIFSLLLQTPLPSDDKKIDIFKADRHNYKTNEKIKSEKKKATQLTMKNKSKFGRRTIEPCWDDERNELNSLLRAVNVFYEIEIGKERQTTLKIAVACGR